MLDRRRVQRGADFVVDTDAGRMVVAKHES